MNSSGAADSGTVVYQSTITAVGDQVGAFVDVGILILFAAGAPVELHPISVLHEAQIEVSGPQSGDVVQIGDTEFPVLAVGDVVEANLLNLGHVDFKADGLAAATLPGDVCIPAGTLALPHVGDVVRILRPTASRR